MNPVFEKRSWFLTGAAWTEAEYRDNAPNGRGACYWPDGGYYEGGFLNGLFHGPGVMYYADGGSESETWENGTFIG